MVGYGVGYIKFFSYVLNVCRTAVRTVFILHLKVFNYNLNFHITVIFKIINTKFHIKFVICCHQIEITPGKRTNHILK
jgi:hypothetical protein